MKKILVNLTQNSYPIYVGQDLISQAELLKSHIHGHQVLIVTQENIAKHYLSFLQTNLCKFQCDTFFLPEGEQYKSIPEWQKIFDALIQNKHERSTSLIALGGGMVGDMTGFAAACYQRGVNYIQIPTSLMAQVDSAIGGKTAVNHALGKNMLGAFYQPQCVISDVNVLKTLSQREFVSGLAEVIKYALIRDANFYVWLENNVDSILQRESEALLHVVSSSAAIKAEIVELDEKDHALRNLLNFGHTFGHALESALNYHNILHGEAVAYGIVVASRLSAALNLISFEDVDRIVDLLNRFGLLQTKFDFPDISYLIELMKSDKKVSNKKINYIVLNKIGEAVRIADVSEEQLIKIVAALTL